MSETTTTQQIQQFRLPDLGEGLEEAQLVQWLVQVGEAISLNQPICQVETAKALVDIPSPFAGVVRELHAQPGDTVPVGGLLITVAPTPDPSPTGGRGENGGVQTASPGEGAGPVLVGYGAGGPAQTFARRRRAPTPDPSPSGRGENGAVAQASSPPSAEMGTDAASAKASPLVRKMAQERGIDLSTIHGTGPNGRIRAEDLEHAAQPSPRSQTGVGI